MDNKIIDNIGEVQEITNKMKFSGIYCIYNIIDQIQFTK